MGENGSFSFMTPNLFYLIYINTGLLFSNRILCLIYQEFSRFECNTTLDWHSHLAYGLTNQKLRNLQI